MNLEGKIMGGVRRLSRFSVVLLASSSFGQGQLSNPALKKPVIYQIGQVVHLNATGPRPLLQAIDALQQKYGWVVDYEDPQYPPASAAAPSRTSPPNRRHANIAETSENAFSVQFNVGPTPDSRPDEATVLTTVVDAYNQSGGAAEFKLLKLLREHDAGFAVIAIGVRDINNEIASQQPVLDLPISLASERRSAGETIALICRKVSEASKVPIAANPTEDLHGNASVAVGGSGVPARTLLSHTIEAMGQNLYWRLIYDAAGKNYVLSIQGLPR